MAAILQFKGEIDSSKPEKSKSVIRHAVFSSILSNKKKFSSEYNEVVIASDGRKYWRKDVFPYYKASRATDRENSDIDWGFVFETLTEIREDIKANFPYRVLHIEGCEADDIIAVISKWTQENYIDDNVLFPEPKKVLIISEDQDFYQLLQYKNISIFHPRKKILVVG